MLSRDQWDTGGDVVAKIVEEVFERYTVLWEVVADGRTIRTTGEHPFCVKGKGWTAANELRVGDRLVCAETGRTVAVESLRDTGERELVYNLRVADFHTYFVGDEVWGWSAWAHNAYAQQYYIAIDDANLSQTRYSVFDGATGLKVRAAPGSTLPVVIDVASASAAWTALRRGKAHVQYGICDLAEQVWRPDNIADKGKWAGNVGLPDARQKAEGSDPNPNPQNSRPTTDSAERDYWDFKTQNPNFFTMSGTAPSPGKVRTGSSSWEDLHAHHIVPKKDSSSASMLPVRQAHQLLRTVGIDPYFGTANLAWAPNWGGHKNGRAYRDAVWARLSALGIQIQSDPTPASVASSAADRVEVVRVLKSIADDFFVANIPM